MGYTPASTFETYPWLRLTLGSNSFPLSPVSNRRRRYHSPNSLRLTISSGDSGSRFLRVTAVHLSQKPLPSKQNCTLNRSEHLGRWYSILSTKAYRVDHANFSNLYVTRDGFYLSLSQENQRF